MQRSVSKIRYLHKKTVNTNVNTQILDYFKTKKCVSETKVVEKLRLIQNLSNEKDINKSSYRNALAGIQKEELSIYQKVQTMYYASILESDKFAHQFLRFMMKNIKVEELDNLTDFELFIMCNSLFKSSIPIENNFLQFIANKARHVSYDCWTLVSFIKCLRHARYYDDNLFIVLSNNLNQQYINSVPISALVHLTMYFADAHYSQTDFIKFLIQNCVKKIDNLNYVRSKDLNNLLWCCCQYCNKDINQLIINSSISDILPNIYKQSKITMNINLLLWLWIVEVDIKDDVKRFLTMETIKQISDTKNFKEISRLSLLLSCVSIEAPNLLMPTLLNMKSKKLEPTYKNHVSARPALEKCIRYLENNKKELGIDNVLFCYQVPCLYLAGIRIESKNGIVNLEIIDDTVCLRNSSIINGQMNLKLRLMEKMNLKMSTIRCEGKSIDTELLKQQTLMLLQ